jgi:hypothetical protein
MSERMRELAERRAALQLRAALQRREIAREVAAVEARLLAADRVIALTRGVLRHPAVIGSAVLVFVLVGRARAVRLLGQAALLAGGVRGLLRSARKTF